MPQYNITYNLDGGVNNETNPDSFVADDLPITLEEPTKEGFVFVAWHLAESLDDELVDGIIDDVEDDVEVWAEWEPETP